MIGAPTVPNPKERDRAALQCFRYERSELVSIRLQADGARAIASRHGYATEQLVIECVALFRRRRRAEIDRDSFSAADPERIRRG